MNDRALGDTVIREVPLLRMGDPVRAAVTALVETGLPALPVVDERGRPAGVFGEREFIGAIFPGYLKELTYAGFVPRSLDDALEKRRACASEPVSKYALSEHVDVDREFSDAGVAEIFLHHRVSIVPVVEGGRVVGVITRKDFFRALAERFMSGV